MPGRDKPDGRKRTPGAVITRYAFAYARSFYDFAAKKLPELDQYPPDKARGTFLQAAIIVSTLIMVQRRTGGAGWNDLCDDVSRSFAPAVQRRHLSAVIDLSCSLLQISRATLKEDTIPSFESLAAMSDQKLVEAIGSWLTLAIAKKPQLEHADLKVAAAIGRSAWTSAAMIARMLQPQKTS
ncbi:MAG: hypothetical protein ACHQ49_03925 [Elusimicrobiota bacterium]